jgi:hypothetical protein
MRLESATDSFRRMIPRFYIGNQSGKSYVHTHTSVIGSNKEIHKL